MTDVDAAEAWLREHDENYEDAKQKWGGIRPTGEYQTPAQEIPRGVDDFAALIESGRATAIVAETRACEQCYMPFVPKVPWQRFHSEFCKRRARRDRWAAYMREYRKRRRAA